MVFKGRERVSRGMDVGSEFMMKQSSGSGSVAPRVNGVFGVEGSEGYVVILPVGMPSDVISWYKVVPMVQTVPSMVGAGRLRLK